MSDEENRRPLASRQSGWANLIAHKIAETPVTPNVISMMSMVFAAIGGAAFCGVTVTDGATRIALLLLAALFCQLRLLCNLFDGMVAVEGGKKTADGAFWNEFPDRVSDALILGGMGVAAGEPWLGWLAAALAVFTAYVRELGSANGLPPDFSGPMAKQHRMAVATVAALVAAFAGLLPVTIETVLWAALWIVTVGAVATVLLRSRRLIADLNAR